MNESYSLTAIKAPPMRERPLLVALALGCDESPPFQAHARKLKCLPLPRRLKSRGRDVEDGLELKAHLDLVADDDAATLHREVDAHAEVTAADDGCGRKTGAVPP